MQDTGGMAARASSMEDTGGMAARANIESLAKPVRDIIESYVTGLSRQGIIWKSDDAAANLPAELLRVLGPASAECQKLKRDLQQANCQREQAVNNLQRCRENIKRMSASFGSLLIAEGLAPEGLKTFSSPEVNEPAMERDKDAKCKNTSETQHQSKKNAEEIAEAKKSLAAEREKLTEWEQRLTAAQEKLTEEQEKLAAGKNQLAVGKNQLTAAQEKLTEEQEKLAAGKNQLATGKNQLTEEQEKLAAGKNQLAAGKNQLAAAQEKLTEREQSLTAAQRKLTEEQKQLTEKKKCDEFECWKIHFEKFVPINTKNPSDVVNQFSIYKLLDIETGSSTEVVLRECKKILKLFHPDKTPASQFNELITRVLLEVKSIVTNDDKKTIYDTHLAAGKHQGILIAMTKVAAIDLKIAKQNINKEEDDATKRQSKEKRDQREAREGEDQGHSARRYQTTGASQKKSREDPGSKIVPFLFDPWSQKSVDGLKKCMFPYIQALIGCSTPPKYKLQWAQHNPRKNVPHDHWVDTVSRMKVNNKMEVLGEITIMQALLDWMNAERQPLPDCDEFIKSTDKREYAIKCFEVYVEIVEVEQVTRFPVDCPLHLHIDHSFWEQLKINDLGMKGWDLMFGWNKEKWKSFL